MCPVKALHLRKKANAIGFQHSVQVCFSYEDDFPGFRDHLDDFNVTRICLVGHFEGLFQQVNPCRIRSTS